VQSVPRRAHAPPPSRVPSAEPARPHFAGGSGRRRILAAPREGRARAVWMFAARLRGLAEELLDGTAGQDVVQRMRVNTAAFRTDCLLQTYISRVRRLVMELGDARSMHPRRAETLRALVARASRPDVGEACRLRAQAFAADSLQAQVKTQRQHQRRKFFLGHAEVDDALRRVQLLTDNMLAFRVNDNEADSCRRRSVQRVVRRNEHVLMVPEASAFLRRAEAILRTAGPATPLGALGFALLLVTGRRTAEVFNGRSVFGRGFNPMSCRFDGQLKKERPQPYEIPLLCAFDLLRAGLDALRARQGPWDAALQRFAPAGAADAAGAAGAAAAGGPADVLALTNEQVNTRYSSNLNRDLKRVYFVPEASNHDCRRSYAQAVWLGYNYDATPVTFNRVAMRFLGHELLEESLKYNSVRLHGFDNRFPEAYRLPVADPG